jgi:hypothetical protein
VSHRALAERALDALDSGSARFTLSAGAAASDPAPAADRRPYLAALARHHSIKRELIPLVAAWGAAGIDVLLYKGFFLAEFVYPAPGTRFHGDVDILIHPEHAPEALRLAQALGWRQRWYPRRVGAADGGALFDLYRPGGAAQLDVHQLLVPAARWWKRRQRAITAGVWARSRLREWEGSAVRLPDPLDAIVVNLALERAVADAARGLKPHDAVDLALLMERGPATRRDLEHHARELGCARTLSFLLRQCEPALVPTVAPSPSRITRLRWQATGAWDGGFVNVPHPFLRAARSPALAWDIATVLPLLARVRRAMRRHRDVRAILADLTHAATPATRGTARKRWRTIRAIHWACKLLPIGPADGSCLPRALAIYAALRRQGWVVEFVSGVRRDPTGLHGHAWVEEDGSLLRELLGWERLPDYEANFRYPPNA